MQPNSLLVCIKKGQWSNDHCGIHNKGPKYEDIVTHDGEREDDPNFIFLVEHPNCPCGCGGRSAFYKKEFREIQPPMSIPESLFNQSPEKITI